MEEPSILDYLKARLTPWRGPAPRIPDLDAETRARDVPAEGVLERTSVAEVMPEPCPQGLNLAFR